jgi:N-acetylmuramoyl-L-alanine amidase
MAGLNDTKAQLLRGVVQDNIDVVQGVKTRRASRRRRLLKPWLSSVLIVAAIAYLTVSSKVILQGGTPAPNAVAANQEPMISDVDQTPVSEISLFNPRPIDRAAIPLSIKRIVIDPGHGGEPGAISPSGVTEKEITLDVGLRLRRLMEKGPFEVLMTRETDRYIPLDKRVVFANENKADLFVSIHVNWMEPHTIRALETYYVGPTDDPATLKLASMENKDSGFSLSDYKKILDKIYVDARRDESRTLARAIHSHLYHSLKQANSELENRGVKTAPFVVLIGTQMPAILVEVACMSNEDELKLLTKEDYRENIARAVMRGLQSYANNLNVSTKKGS